MRRARLGVAVVGLVGLLLPLLSSCQEEADAEWTGVPDRLCEAIGAADVVRAAYPDLRVSAASRGDADGETSPHVACELTGRPRQGTGPASEREVGIAIAVGIYDPGGPGPGDADRRAQDLDFELLASRYGTQPQVSTASIDGWWEEGVRRQGSWRAGRFGEGGGGFSSFGSVDAVVDGNLLVTVDVIDQDFLDGQADEAQAAGTDLSRHLLDRVPAVLDRA